MNPTDSKTMRSLAAEAYAAEISRPAAMPPSLGYTAAMTPDDDGAPGPDRPALRPLEVYPTVRDGSPMLALTDPAHIARGVTVVPPAVAAILQLCDGSSTRDEILEQLARLHGLRLDRERLDRVLGQLDEALLLDSPHFREHVRELFAGFARSPTRPALLAGESYPADGAALSALIEAQFAPPRGPGLPATGPATGPMPRLIVSPHIDFARGGPLYAWAYRPLLEAAELPELVVIFGTEHSGHAGDTPAGLVLTRKHFETPLGTLETDLSALDKLLAAVDQRGGPELARSLCADEQLHRAEHSIEFQAVWLKFVLARRGASVRILPILCGAASQPEARATVLEAVARLAERQRTLFIAGADLAHVGPRFGDPTGMSRADCESLERRDRESLEPVLRGDAGAWLEEIRREDDRRRICGLEPIYAALVASAATGGRLAAYGQVPADEAGASVVSAASLVF